MEPLHLYLDFCICCYHGDCSYWTWPEFHMTPEYVQGVIVSQTAPNSFTPSFFFSLPWPCVMSERVSLYGYLRHARGSLSGQKWLKGSRAETACFRQDELMRSTVTWNEQGLFSIVECPNKNAELETRKKWIPLQSVMLKHASCFGQSGEILKKAKEHTKQINDIQTSVDLTMFISASKDNTAKVSL